MALLLVTLGGAGVYFWSRSNHRPDAAEAAGGRPTTAVVAFGDVNFVVSVAGEIGPAEQVSVRPEVNGRIAELPVDVGDRVAKGGLLFALDDRDLRIELETRQKEIESAKLQLDKARIAMEQAKRDHDRDKELFEAGLLAEQEYEASRQRYESAIKDHDLALNSIERSEKELDLSKERLLKTRIQAPFDCTVLTRPVSVGQAVSGSGGFNSGTEVLTIADLSSLVIDAHVNQADVAHLRPKMEVAVEVDAMPGLMVRGEVERMAPQATLKNNIKGYATRIVLRDIDARLQPGMTATLSIPVSSAESVLTVPLAAVFSEEGERYVFVKEGERFERRPVVVGITDFFNAEIRSGLSEGEIVALEQPAGSEWRIPGGGPTVSLQGNSRPQRQLAGATNTPAVGTAVRPASSATAEGGGRPAVRRGSGT
jgi:HlyD family secretion protein